MFLTVISIVGVFGHLSNGVPLENLSADFNKFFSSRIVGGTDAAEGKAPYMTALVIGHTWQSFICGGSIISNKCVLTAAHCIVVQWNGGLLDTFHGIVGTNTWHRGTVIEFKDYRNHPNYDSWLIKNDIGVLLTTHKILMNERVAPIGVSFDRVGGGHKSYVTGWGTDTLWGITPEVLQFLNVTTLSHKECVKTMNRVVAEAGGTALPIDPDVELCTFHSPGRGMCHGDSGSGLVSRETYQLIGLTSWGLPCARGAPDVFASTHGLQWFLKEFLNRD